MVIVKGNCFNIGSGFRGIVEFEYVVFFVDFLDLSCWLRCGY